MLPKLKLTASSSASLLKYTSAALFIFIPLYPKFPLFFVPGSSVAVRVEDLLIFVAAIFLGVNLWLKKTNPFRLPLFFQIIVYALIGILSLISAIFITHTILPHIGLLHLVRRLEYFAAFFIVYQATKNNSLNQRFFLQIFIFTSIVVFVYALAQMYFYAPVISTMNEEFSKGLSLRLQPGVPISSTFGGHYDLAVYLVFVLSILAAVYAKAKKILLRLVLGILFLALTWLLFQTGARITVFTGLVSIPLVLYLSRRARLIPLFFLVFIVAFATSPNLMNRFSSFLNIFKAKLKITSQLVVAPAFALNSTTTQEEPSPLPSRPPEPLRAVQQDRSFSIRLDQEWPRALRSLAKNPLLGTGYSSITLATDNDYLRSLGETGLLGFFAFISILLATARLGIRNLKLKAKDWWQTISPAYAGIFSAMIIAALLLDVFEASKIAIIFWMLTGLSIASLNHAKNN